MLSKNVFILFILIKLSLTLVPIWEINGNAVSFFPSGTPNFNEITAYNEGYYKLTNYYTKNSDGTISVEHKLKITKDSNTNENTVSFKSMKAFVWVPTYGEILCPEGKFYPLDSDGNQITMPISNADSNWHLKCVGHGTGVFLAFYLNKDCDSLYGYLAEKDGGI